MRLFWFSEALRVSLIFASEGAPYLYLSCWTRLSDECLTSLMYCYASVMERFRSKPHLATDSLSPQFSFTLVLTESQVDETKLSARLIPNQLQADGEEAIRIGRCANNIEVEGSIQRKWKRQLQTELCSLTYTTVSILSIEDFRSQPAPRRRSDSSGNCGIREFIARDCTTSAGPN